MFALKKWVWVPLLLCSGYAVAEECSYENNATHLDLSKCLNDEYQRMDQLLVEKITEMTAQSQQNMDALQKMVGKQAPNLTEQLNQSYQTFKQYRDQTCLWVENMYLPGNAGGVNALRCMIDLTKGYMDTLDSLQIDDMVD